VATVRRDKQTTFFVVEVRIVPFQTCYLFGFCLLFDIGSLMYGSRQIRSSKCHQTTAVRLLVDYLLAISSPRFPKRVFLWLLDLRTDKICNRKNA